MIVLQTQHPIPPFWDSQSKILILGSFPSVKSRECGFFYGHPRNRFWKVCAAVLEKNAPETIDDKKQFLCTNHIALWDVIAACEINGSSDASIKNASANDISPILTDADIAQIFVNGRTAETLYNKHILPVCGRTAITLPSTSPANAAWSPERLQEAWSILRHYL